MNAFSQTFDLALRHHQAGNLQQAEELYRQILAADSNHVDALHLLGVIAGQSGRPDLAVEYIRQALALRPDFALAHNNLGEFLKDLGQLNEAIASYAEALRCQPDLAMAHNNLGNAFRVQGRLDEAVASYREALRLKWDLAEAHDNLGIALGEQGRLDEAVASHEEAVRLKPDFAEAHNNLGIALRDQGRFGDAIGSVRAAIRLKPEYDEAHYNLGILLLLVGNFDEGWPEHEWRCQLKRLAYPTFRQPRWDGSSLIGKTILLYAEQGLGDTLHFIRYAPLVKHRGGKVLFACPTELVRIMQSCAGIDEILTHGSPLPPFDVQAPLLSLPGIMKTTLSTMPTAIPYLNADPALVETWRWELSKYSDFKIGIVWQGNPRFSQHECRGTDRRRSIPLASFEPLTRLPGVQLFSLQKGFGTEQLAEWQARFGIIDLGDRLKDFMDTAAVMMNLDLIISACTSPVHLAGALGRPVWTLLSFAACWRWLLDRTDSPWYPTMRLFRQKKPDDWAEVFEGMARELYKRIANFDTNKELPTDLMSDRSRRL
jgi:Tfp pilus assembly protein PilF